MNDSELLKKIVTAQARHGEILLQLSETLSTIQQHSQSEESRQREVLLDLLEVYDSLRYSVEALVSYRPVDKLFRHSRTEDVEFIKRIKQGQQISLRHIQRMLDRYQLKPVLTEKQHFNPETMVAVSIENNPKESDGMVLFEMRPGFYWRDTVLRRAEVSVNRHQDV